MATLRDIIWYTMTRVWDTSDGCYYNQTAFFFQGGHTHVYERKNEVDQRPEDMRCRTFAVRYDL